MMARVKEAAGTIEAWLRSAPGPLYSDVSPRAVFRMAHDLYVATCSNPDDLGTFTDHLWGRGITLEAVGTRYWLKLPGKDRTHALATADNATRIDQ